MESYLKETYLKGFSQHLLSYKFFEKMLSLRQMQPLVGVLQSPSSEKFYKLHGRAF